MCTRTFTAQIDNGGKQGSQKDVGSSTKTLYCSNSTLIIDDSMSRVVLKFVIPEFVWGEKKSL